MANDALQDLADSLSPMIEEEAGAIADLPSKAEPSENDLLMIEDVADGNSPKKVTIGSLPGGGGGPPAFTGLVRAPSDPTGEHAITDATHLYFMENAQGANGAVIEVASSYAGQPVWLVTGSGNAGYDGYRLAGVSHPAFPGQTATFKFNNTGNCALVIRNEANDGWDLAMVGGGFSVDDNFVSMD